MSAAITSVAWAWTGLPCLGHRVSGDLVLLREDVDSPSAIMVDVAGHGPAAHAVAQRIVSMQPLSAPIAETSLAVRRIHEGLAGSGSIAAVMALRILTGGQAPTLELCGVGNIRIAIAGHASRYEGQPGMAGQQIPTLRVRRVALTARGTIVVFTDGISGSLNLTQEMAFTPVRQLPMLLLQRYGRPYDDATCLVIRFGES